MGPLNREEEVLLNELLELNGIEPLLGDDLDTANTLLRRRTATSLFSAGAEQAHVGFESFRNVTTGSSADTNLNLNSTLKERHLSKRERQAFHKPKSDILSTDRGEVCKNACTLEVDDLIAKIK